MARNHSREISSNQGVIAISAKLEEERGITADPDDKARLAQAQCLVSVRGGGYGAYVRMGGHMESPALHTPNVTRVVVTENQLDDTLEVWARESATGTGGALGTGVDPTFLTPEQREHLNLLERVYEVERAHPKDNSSLMGGAPEHPEVYARFTCARTIVLNDLDDHKDPLTMVGLAMEQGLMQPEELHDPDAVLEDDGDDDF